MIKSRKIKLLKVLKSNMDRFIEELHKVITLNTKILKSNMDRFIARTTNFLCGLSGF